MALVAAASLSVGVLAAWWGTALEPNEEDEHVSVMRESRGEGSAESGAAMGGPEAVASPEADAGAAPPADRADLDDAPVAPPAPEAEPDDEAVSPPVEPAPPSDLRVRQGRVAYIRCDGIDDCPRDESMEEAVWAIIETLPACPTGPRASGEADIRLDYRGTSQPAVAWRDTFPSSTVRLEREAVLGCVRDPLTGTRQSLGAERLLVSFRFAME